MSVKEKLTALADAIRDKTGTTQTMTLDDMITCVQNLSVSTADPEQMIGLRYVSVNENHLPTEIDASTLPALSRCQFSNAVDAYYNDYPLYSAVTKITLPAGITALPSACFYRCAALCEVVWPDTIATIDRYCFSYCNNMSFPALPTGLTTIEPYAFAYVSSSRFTTVTFPAALKTIKANAFRGNSSLTTVTFLGTPSSIVSTAFNECTSITDIYVPWSEGAVSGAPWGAKNATVHYQS